MEVLRTNLVYGMVFVMYGSRLFRLLHTVTRPEDGKYEHRDSVRGDGEMKPGDELVSLKERKASGIATVDGNG